MQEKITKILAIETSCDETSAAVVELKIVNEKLTKVNNSYTKQPILTNINHCQPLLTIQSNIVSSQVKLHAKYGGVYPEMASREHVKNIMPVIEETLYFSNPKSQILNSKQTQNPNFSKLSHLKFNKNLKLKIKNSFDAIAVTTGPGLIGSLLVGVETAKTISYVLEKPIYPINHVEGHIYSNFVRVNSKLKSQKSKLQLKTENLNQPPKFPLIALVVSGGHTSLIYMKNHLQYKIIGETLDDAAGEAFDKVAKMLDLGYPGGPAISAEAEKLKIVNKKLIRVNNSYQKATIINHLQPLLTNINQIKFPRPMINSGDFDFSFSGLKTAVLYAVKKLPQPINQSTKQLICREFQDAVVEILIAKTIKAAKKYMVKSILLCGGVAANKQLRNALRLATYNINLDFFVPRKNLCTDNATMIGIAAVYKIALGVKPSHWYNVNAQANLKLG